MLNTLTKFSFVQLNESTKDGIDHICGRHAIDITSFQGFYNVIVYPVHLSSGLSDTVAITLSVL